MSRWIEVDEILKHKCDVYDINDHVLHAVPTGHILSAPSLDLVRCAECKHWQDNNGGYPTTECRWGHDETPDADDFCSYGERKESE
jgi:hypothetical protein